MHLLRVYPASISGVYQMWLALNERRFAVLMTDE